MNHVFCRIALIVVGFRAMDSRARRQADGTDKEADQDAGGARIRDRDQGRHRVGAGDPGCGLRSWRLPSGKVAVSISEAREIAESHWRHYTGAAIEKYELWARGLEGDYVRLESRRAGVPPMPIRRRIENRLSWLTALCLGAALPLGPGVVAPLRFIPAFTDFLTRLTQVLSCFLRIALDLFRCPVRIFPDLPCSRPLPVSVAAARCKYQPDRKHKK
jgi:hypothetical protein